MVFNSYLKMKICKKKVCLGSAIVIESSTIQRSISLDWSFCYARGMTADALPFSVHSH